MILRTGVDIVEIQRLEQVNPAIRERFIRRVFTPLEIELARGSYASLAGRFAAKEAVAKALGTGIGPVSWQDIEIRRDASGAPVLHLHGRAAEAARLLGLTTWSVSISHGRTHAVAMAVALGEGRE
ncbi:holo-ACP synthase [Anaerolinea sp.]|uniref:holo-ACP synthase n=1 Tax=Anaerolinea sp. TaxID=1872519 RepID=UPI002ACD94E1|nr:holo-ACP synthase [Anaerolinea sp.]